MLTAPILAYSLLVSTASGDINERIIKGTYPEKLRRIELIRPRRDPDPGPGSGSAPNRYMYDPTWPNLEPLFRDCRSDSRSRCRD